MGRYEARWNNALGWAKRVNAAIEGGYLVSVAGVFLDSPLEITPAEICRVHPGGRSRTLIFRNDPAWDNGMHDTIGRFDAAHETRCYRPAPLPLAHPGAE